MTTKTVTVDDITGEIIDPKQIHTIELRITSGDYAGASVELDLSTKTFEAKILELLDHGDLNKILGKSSSAPVAASEKSFRRPPHRYTYINTDVEPEDLVEFLAKHRVQAGQRKNVAINERLQDRVLRSGQVRIREAFRLTNITDLRDRLAFFGLDMVIDKTFRSVANGKVLGTFGDIYAVPKSKY